MHQVIYSSRCTRSFSDTELSALLEQARKANATRGITGLLLHGGGMFVQVLEGESSTVQHLCARLLADARHTDMLVLADKPIARRSFAGWAMAFQHVPPALTAGLPGVMSAAQLATQLTSLAPADALLLHSLRRQLFTPDEPA